MVDKSRIGKEGSHMFISNWPIKSISIRFFVLIYLQIYEGGIENNYLPGKVQYQQCIMETCTQTMINFTKCGIAKN